MKTTVDKDKLDDNNKTQGDYISHKEQRDHFFKPPQQSGYNAEDEHSKTGSEKHGVHDSVEVESVQSSAESGND